MENNKLVETIVKALDEKKGMELKVLDIHAQTGIADYFIIASGTSSPHTKALSDFVEEKVEIPEDVVYPCFCRTLEKAAKSSREKAECVDEDELRRFLEKVRRKYDE